MQTARCALCGRSSTIIDCRLTVATLSDVSLTLARCSGQVRCYGAPHTRPAAPPRMLRGRCAAGPAGSLCGREVRVPRARRHRLCGRHPHPRRRVQGKEGVRRGPGG
eukprot:1821863-Pyramimonas_sp.AAC.2